MAGELELIEVSLLSGESNKQTLTFTPGTPANHVGIGTGGEWIVLAEGVLPVHLYLVFDGRHVHVAAGAPDARTLLAGTPVGMDWVRASIPCELRFGGACLILRCVPRPKPLPDEDATMHDGGALRQAAQRISHSPPLAPEYPATRPAAGEPASARESLHDERDEDGPTPMLVAGEDDHHPRVRTLPPTFIASPPSPSRNETTEPPLVRPDRLGEIERFWRESSLVKKATLVLMPFALVASYQLLLAEPPEPAARTAAGTDKPAGSTGDAGSAPALAGTASQVFAAAVDGGVTTAGPEIDSVTGAAPGSVTPLPLGKRTPERQALDTAAAGSFDDAAKLYTTLAASHPDDPSYKEAARILREKAGHTDETRETR